MRLPLSRLLVTLLISIKWVCLETLRLLVSSSCQTTQIHAWRNFQQSLVNKTPSKVVQHTQRETFWDSSFHQPTLELSEELTVTWELVGCRMPSPLVSTSSTTQTRVTNNSVVTLTRQRWRITIRWLVSVQRIQREHWLMGLRLELIVVLAIAVLVDWCTQRTQVRDQRTLQLRKTPCHSLFWRQGCLTSWATTQRRTFWRRHCLSLVQIQRQMHQRIMWLGNTSCQTLC